MTLIYECDLDISKMYRHTKSELSSSRLLNVEHYGQTDRQTDEQMRLKLGDIGPFLTLIGPLVVCIFS